MTFDDNKMFANYINKRLQVLNEGTYADAGLEQANSKRLIEILDMIKSDANMATQFALTPEEFAGVIEWAKNKFAATAPASKPGHKDESGALGGPVFTTKRVGESVVKEKKQTKDEDNMDMVKPKTEETEEEYLARRDSAIRAAIAAKEESEEQTALNSHYNVNHEALDLVDSLLNHARKYSKADAIKILTMASDRLQNKA